MTEDQIERALAGTLADWRERPFAWGVCDCGVGAADYVLRATGMDPAVEWRDAYRTADGSADVSRKAGGVVGLVTSGMASIGIHPSDGPPERGDVVVAGIGDVLLAGIHLGHRTAFKHEGGYRETRRLPIVTVWSLRTFGGRP